MYRCCHKHDSTSSQVMAWKGNTQQLQSLSRNNQIQTVYSVSKEAWVVAVCMEQTATAGSQSSRTFLDTDSPKCEQIGQKHSRIPHFPRKWNYPNLVSLVTIWNNQSLFFEIFMEKWVKEVGFMVRRQNSYQCQQLQTHLHLIHWQSPPHNYIECAVIWFH